MAVEAIDQGPGIRNLEEILAGRYKSRSGLGLGILGTKRLADRVQELAVKPDRLAERIEEVLSEPDPTRAMIALCELQLDALALAPSGPNVDRAKRWVGEALEVLREN